MQYENIDAVIRDIMDHIAVSARWDGVTPYGTSIYERCWTALDDEVRTTLTDEGDVTTADGAESVAELLSEEWYPMGAPHKAMSEARRLEELSEEGALGYALDAARELAADWDGDGEFYAAYGMLLSERLHYVAVDALWGRLWGYLADALMRIAEDVEAQAAELSEAEGED